jgi:hypothetical protein
MVQGRVLKANPNYWSPDFITGLHPEQPLTANTNGFY